MDLYWVPVGAGGHCVRVSGRVFEAIEAARDHRRRCDLYHTALIVKLDGERYAIELAPSWDPDTASRGVVCTGAAGSRWRLFRYELRCSSRPHTGVGAWLIAGAGIATDRVQPPTGGRAPGWHAGLLVALHEPRWMPTS